MKAIAQICLAAAAAVAVILTPAPAAAQAYEWPLRLAPNNFIASCVVHYYDLNETPLSAGPCPGDPTYRPMPVFDPLLVWGVIVPMPDEVRSCEIHRDGRAYMIGQNFPCDPDARY